jgi:hypothetical protein
MMARARSAVFFLQGVGRGVKCVCSLILCVGRGGHACEFGGRLCVCVGESKGTRRVHVGRRARRPDARPAAPNKDVATPPPPGELQFFSWGCAAS